MIHDLDLLCLNLGLESHRCLAKGEGGRRFKVTEGMPSRGASSGF